MRSFIPRVAILGAAVLCSIVDAANQTPAVSPVVVGAQPIGMQILPAIEFSSAIPPSLHSFVKASYFSPAVGHSQWVLFGGMTNGLHDLADAGFDPASHNRSVHVIDPVTQEVWSRSLTDPSAGLSSTQIESIATTNAQYSQIGSKLYVSGGYGFSESLGKYHTYDNLTAYDLPALIDWVKNDTGSAAGSMQQISDPIFRVTGGEMATTPNGKTHLVFGQDYPDSYNSRQDGIYTNQVRTFNIVDDINGLSVTNVVSHAAQPDYRRRDLNVVPIIKKIAGQPTAHLQALSGVFTTSFGVWTVPVTIDADGNATQPDPNAAGTFKQGMNSYRSANIGLYSSANDTMHTLLLGGISFQYYDPGTGQILSDAQIPFVNDSTDIVTDSLGNMTQYLLDNTYPTLTSGINGNTLLLGAETEFFLNDGVTTYANGVIDLDALSPGPNLIGWLYGGLAADAPNHGNTIASNAIFPVVINVLPEPGLLGVASLFLLGLGRRRR